MKIISIAVCDINETYGKRLGGWISFEKKERLKGYCFSSPENFLEFQKVQNIEVVLLGDGFYENSYLIEQIKMQKELEQTELVEQDKYTEVLWIYLYDSTEEKVIPDIIEELPRIEKYQPASEIVREIFSCIQKFGKKEQEHIITKREVIAVYSPIYSMWQTPFSLTLAQTLSEQEKVLYVNFNECAGFAEWFQEIYHKDLLDVIYMCLMEEGTTRDCISSVTYTLEGFDYIPPMEDGECISGISKQDYKKFIKILSEKSGYDVVILDFGRMLPGFFELLEMCNKVYIFSETGELQEGPLQHFKKMALKQKKVELEEKISYLILPKMTFHIGRGEQKMKQWIWGELGDYTRKLVGVQVGAD